MNGILVVDKPAGTGSTDVVRAVRRAAGQRRVGHTGTLDPQATGVLVVCLGRGTRLVRFLQAGRKVYRADLLLGVETSTYDAAGAVVTERSAAHIDEAALRAALARQTGRLRQVPPMVSAVKVGGERLYEKARRGEEVEREPRDVTVYRLELERFEPGERARATLVIECSAGTYIRSIAHDVGEDLGCGASLTALRRLRNGPFTEADAVPLDEVVQRGHAGTLEAVTLPLAEVARAMPVRAVTREEARAVATGRPLPPRGVEGPTAVLLDGDLIAVYDERDGTAHPEAVLVQPEELVT